MLMDFLSDHSSEEKVVMITVEPDMVYFEESRDSLDLNFDFVIKGLTEKNLLIKFIKVAIYDESRALITFKHLNHNGVGTPSIYTIGKYDLKGQEVIDVPRERPNLLDGTGPNKYLKLFFSIFSPISSHE